MTENKKRSFATETIHAGAIKDTYGSLGPVSYTHLIKKLLEKAKELGVGDGIDPFMTLGFMALPVIPDIKMTDKGLFDVNEFKHIPLEV